MPILSFEHVTLGYDGHTVVEDLNFSVQNGDYLCIIGENGAGKSTLLKTLLHLKKPLKGKIRTEDGFSQKQIGYLPQQTQAQRDFPATVWEVILSGCQNRCGLRPFYSVKEKEMARDNMEKLGITPLKNSSYRNLSGGQQQRVLLARALCATEILLILDEPVSGLDPHAASEMYELIRHLNQEEKITVMMVTHDLSSALCYATHILHVSRTPLFFGTKADYFNSSIGKRFLAHSGFGQKGGSEQ